MRNKTTAQIGRKHGFFSEEPCLGCSQPLNTPDPEARLCPDCLLEMIVNLAHILAPSEDVTPRLDLGHRAARVSTDSEFAKTLESPLADIKPTVGDVYPWARAQAVVDFYCHAALVEDEHGCRRVYAIDPGRLARSVALEMAKLEYKTKKREK